MLELIATLWLYVFAATDAWKYEDDCASRSLYYLHDPPDRCADANYAVWTRTWDKSAGIASITADCDVNVFVGNYPISDPGNFSIEPGDNILIMCPRNKAVDIEFRLNGWLY